MRKYWKYGLMALSSLLVLTACQNIDQAASGDAAVQDNSQNNAVQVVQATTNQLSNDFYRALITDNQYTVSKTRGATLSLNNGFNLRNFEVGLLNISKRVFPTNQYFFREGQIIDSDSALQWISRQSDDNPDGLNPAANASTDPATRAPLYLAQILEQDFMIQTENNYELGGVAIGLAMNSVDYYTADDKNLEQEISDEVLMEQAKEMANKVLTRLRQNDSLKTVPIVFGIFKQAPKDDLGGGVYLMEATSIEGTEITNWTSIKEEVVVLPLLTGNTTDESSAFENFRSEVQDFFPNLSGVTAKVTYKEGVATKMVVTVMTQFYGESEIIALAQHVTDVANKYLPKTTPVEVRISSINGMEAFLLLDTNQGIFTYHIFD